MGSIFTDMKQIFRALGLMSGTSLDGVDLCYAEFQKKERWKFRIIKAETVRYSKTWKSKLENARYLSGKELTLLDQEYGSFLGEISKKFVEENKIAHLDVIGSHGHTVFHSSEMGMTKQIGDGRRIAHATKTKVIYDFRTMDVILGGQGAPLVPIGDELLFYEYDACLNLGGFSNISFKEEGKRIAFDICPVNVVLNQYSKKLGFPFDLNGKLSKSGTVHTRLLNKLNRLSFYQKNESKSLGIEWADNHVFPLIDKCSLNEKDVLRTFVEHISMQIGKFLKEKSTVLVSGGGARNQFLMKRLKHYSKTFIHIPDNEIIDFKEALIFAFLAVLKDRNEINVLSSATGAIRDHSSGIVIDYRS